MKAHRARTHGNRRQGTTYIVVLISSLIVATIGLGALQLLRSQARAAADGNDFVTARFHARAAVEIGMLKIRNDPNWRMNLGNGNWLTSQPIGTGKFALSAVDPLDNDVKNGDNHPVVLTGTGQQGTAVFNTSVRLEVGPPAGSCLEVSMISGNDLSVNGATLTSDQTVGANDKVSASGGATVNADVEAFGTIGGSTYTKAKLQKTVARLMPDSLHALDYYLAHGTTIPYSALRTWPQPELLTKTTFETDTVNWYALGACTLQKSNTQHKAGNFSLKVTARSVNTAVAAQDVPVGSLRSGDTYQLWLPTLPTAAANAQAVLTLQSTGSGTQAFMTPLTSLPNNAWTDVRGTITPTWTGTLTKATVSLSIDVAADFYMDEVSLLNVSYPSGYYVLDGLLSPSVNPFGGATNAEGIYVINCSSQNVLIGRSRIVGTLVFVNPGNNTSIQGPLVWEAAVYNYPALLTNDTLKINFSSAGFSEASFGANLNPPGTPYPYNGGTANTTYTDSYPSKITGLIYSVNKLTFSATPNVTGVVIANDDINVNGTSLTLNYSPVYLNDPPPGFNCGTIIMKIAPGTWQRQVN